MTNEDECQEAGIKSCYLWIFISFFYNLRPLCCQTRYNFLIFTYRILEVDQEIESSVSYKKKKKRSKGNCLISSREKMNNVLMCFTKIIPFNIIL